MSVVVAQDDPPRIAPAEPVAVLQLASIDELLADVDYLLAAGEVGRYSQVVRGFIAGVNNLDGLDRARPLGGMLFVDPADPSREPQPVLFVPVSDVGALRATIVGTGNALEPTERPDLFDLRLGKDRLHLVLSGGYGFVLDPARSPASFDPQHIVALIESTQTDFDATLSLRRAGLPESVVARAVAELLEDAARQLERRESESDAEHELRSQVEGSVFEIVRLVLAEGQELHIGMHLGAGRPLTMIGEFRTEAGSELQAWTQQTLAPPEALPTGDPAVPALSWRGAVALSDTAQQVGRRVVQLAHDQVLRELGPQAPADVRQHVDAAFAALDATVGAGRLESRVDFVPTPSGRFVLLAGAVVEQAEALNAAAKALLPLAVKAGDLKSVELDQWTAAGWSFHRIEGGQVRERDRRLYGSDLALFVAAGDGAAWLAVGGPETSETLAAALASFPPGSIPPDAANLTVRLKPWIDFALREGLAKDRRLAELADQLLTGESTVSVGLHPSDRGLRASVIIDEAYVQLLARAAVLRLQPR